MHAVKEFDPYKDVKLISYAVWWIRGYIQEFLMRQYSMVRIGTTQNQRKLFYQLRKQQDELERMGFEAGIKQLSGRLNIPEKEIINMSQRLGGRDVSLSYSINEDGSSTLLDVQTDETAEGADTMLGQLEELSSLHENLDAIRPELNEKEIYVLDNRLLADPPKTLQEIGNKWGVTREAVRQLEARLIKKIRQQMLD